MSLRNASAAKVDIVDALGSAVKVRKKPRAQFDEPFRDKNKQKQFPHWWFAVLYEFNSGDMKWRIPEKSSNSI